MKKLLGIVVLCLLLSGNAFAECIKGDCKEGYGEYIYENGKYLGNWHKGKFSGKGRYEWGDGTWQEGNFTKGKLNGEATEYNAKKKYTYKGNFRKDKWHGDGLLTYENGKKYDVYSRKGKLKSKIERVKPITQEEVIKKYLSNRKLEKIEGVWVTKGGAIFVAYKDKGEYLTKFIKSERSKSGETFIENFTSGATNVFNGNMKCRTSDGVKLTCKINLVAYEYNLKGSFNYPDWITRENWQGPTYVDFSWSRVWPDDFVAYNKKFRTKDDLNEEQKNLALIVNDVKKTCSVLGFEEGSEKFADCTLKLYTQKIDEMVAEKQARNQQLIQSQQANTTTQSSSGTNTTIIYDPVRDRQNQIDKGMKMLGGKCTLGIDC